MLPRLRRLVGLGPRGARVDLPDEEAPRPIEGENLLFVSDVHLGEGCKEHSRIEYMKRAAELDAHLCGFLDHFTHHRLDGLPWRLVMGGDLVDFLQVTMVPQGTEGDARRFGLGTREEESAWKLRRLVERHRAVFLYLAAFIGAGNRVEIIQGNHDEELFWPAVRAALLQCLVELYFGDEGHADESPDDFTARIHFNPWFYYRPGLLYVEHGHRFDTFCATPPQLCPLRPQDEAELVQPISALAIRYFANLERGFKTHDKEHWGLGDYFRYYRSRGWGHVFDVVGRYLGLVTRATSYHLEHGRHASEQAAEAHARRVAELAELNGLEVETLRRLEALGAPTVTALPFGLFTVLGMAEWSAIAGFLGALAVALITDLGWVPDLLLCGGAAALGLAWVRFARRRFPTDIKRKLDVAADALHAVLDVPVVVLGHSHRPVRRRMRADHRAFYCNTGSFLATEGPPHAADAPCTCRCTFVTLPRVGPHARPTPTLRRWCTVRRAPAPFEPAG